MTELAVEQLQKILKGNFTNWAQAGGSDTAIQVVEPSPNIHAGSIYFVEHDLLENHSITTSAANAGSFDSVIRMVADRESAIGFTRVRDIEAHQGETQIRVLKMKQDANSPAVQLSRSAIADGTYPLKATLLPVLTLRGPRLRLRNMSILLYPRAGVRKEWNRKVTALNGLNGRHYYSDRSTHVYCTIAFVFVSCYHINGKAVHVC